MITDECFNETGALDRNEDQTSEQKAETDLIDGGNE
jgi:hypothetical protein